MSDSSYSDFSRRSRRHYGREPHGHHSRHHSRHHSEESTSAEIKRTLEEQDDRITSIEKSFRRWCNQGENNKKNISNIYDRLIDHRDYLKTYEDKILRLETTLQRDLHYERERRKECEGRIDELTRALNESREKIQALLDFCFTDKSQWKEGAVHSGFAGVNCTLDVRKEDANEGQSNPVAIGDTSIGINHIKKEEPIVKETGHDPFNINIGNDSFEFLI